MIWHKTAGMWVSDCDRYQVVEVAYKGHEPCYHCYERMSPRGYKFIGYRVTPELAKEYCESKAGKL